MSTRNLLFFLFPAAICVVVLFLYINSLNNQLSQLNNRLLLIEEQNHNKVVLLENKITKLQEMLERLNSKINNSPISKISIQEHNSQPTIDIQDAIEESELTSNEEDFDEEISAADSYQSINEEPNVDTTLYNELQVIINGGLNEQLTLASLECKTSACYFSFYLPLDSANDSISHDIVNNLNQDVEVSIDSKEENERVFIEMFISPLTN